MKQLEFNFISESTDISILREISQYRTPKEFCEAKNIKNTKPIYALIRKYTGKEKSVGQSYKEYLIKFFKEETDIEKRLELEWQN